MDEVPVSKGWLKDAIARQRLVGLIPNQIEDEIHDFALRIDCAALLEAGLARQLLDGFGDWAEPLKSRLDRKLCRLAACTLSRTLEEHLEIHSTIRA